MLEIRQTNAFFEWFRKLRDMRAKDRIAARIRRVQESGSFGDAKHLGDGVSEMRIDYGPGYRIYFAQKGQTVVILLCGGDKRGQEADIAKAKAMAKELDQE